MAKKPDGVQPLLYIQPLMAGRLFGLCWLAYFASYIGRLNYAAVMAEIIQAEGFSGAAAGLVGTGFFLCYGGGQMVSGYLGDKLPPQHMVTVGLLCSAACNAAMVLCASAGAMLVVWCANGFIQSLLWTPILRIIAEYFAPAYRKKACVNIATTYPVACLLVYAGSAGLLVLAGWRMVFVVSAVLLVAVAFVWRVGFARLRAFRTVAVVGADGPPIGKPNGKNAGAVPPAQGSAGQQVTGRDGEMPGGKPCLPKVVLLLFCLALVFQGILRDGVTAWVPAFLSQNFAVGTALAIGCTTLLPVVNLAGVYAAQTLYKRLRRESVISLFLFCAAAIFAGILLWSSGFSLVLSLIAFALITSCMMGVNLMLVSFVPTYFARQGKVSFVAGLLNSSVYVGSSIAAFGIGAVADGFGWHVLLGLLLAAALCGGVACLLARPGWQTFIRNAEY